MLERCQRSPSGAVRDDASTYPTRAGRERNGSNDVRVHQYTEDAGRESADEFIGSSCGAITVSGVPPEDARPSF